MSTRCSSIIFHIIGLLVVALILSSCENAADKQNRWQKEGYQNGYAVGFQDGKKLGYENGFATVHPANKRGYPSYMDIILKVIAWGGAIKIALSSVIICLILIVESKSGDEVLAKTLLGFLGATVGFFIEGPTGIGALVSSVLLIPAPSSAIGIWGTIVFSAVTTYYVAKLFQFWLGNINGVKAEAWSMFFISAISVIVIHGVFDFMFKAPNINGFIASTILFGVFAGGILFIIQQLLNEAERKRKADAA